MKNWRLISPRYNDAYTNMAIDEATLQGYIAGVVPPTFRVYGWKPDAISLGYFQKVGEVLDIANCQQQGVSFVRRITGGEAIFHSNDVSYSIICSKEDLALPKSIKSSFRVLASFLINAYKALGAKAYFSCEDKNEVLQRKRSSFCFASRQDFDILIGGKKLGGNAQKRLKNIIFQHGSVPLTLDIKKIKGFIREDLSGIENRATALKDALGKNISFNEFSSAIIDSFRKTFSLKPIEAELSSFELKLIEGLRKEKYGCRKWNLEKAEMAK
ncbi:MAG: lipoate--protein ligase family protein [Candidatus Omnitrophica bacterium]|nr:lipoate--protein ligase family protein [Candidatus Omnitrophota bacterium]